MSRPPNRCPKCNEAILLDEGGLVDFHKVPGDKFNTCPGSKCNPKSLQEKERAS